ncbi:hypothetical protein ACLBX9_27930 [Methylobacterium sp. A49B]
MPVRCQVICDDDAIPSEHDFPTMPRAGDVFVFPGQYSVYEIAEVRHELDASEGAVGSGSAIAVVFRREPERQKLATLEV